MNKKDYLHAKHIASQIKDVEHDLRVWNYSDDLIVGLQDSVTEIQKQLSDEFINAIKISLIARKDALEKEFESI